MTITQCLGRIFAGVIVFFAYVFLIGLLGGSLALDDIYETSTLATLLSPILMYSFYLATSGWTAASTGPYHCYPIVTAAIVAVLTPVWIIALNMVWWMVWLAFFSPIPAV